MVVGNDVNIPTAEKTEDAETSWAEKAPLRKVTNHTFVQASQNDEEERNQRRSMAHLQKKISAGGATATGGDQLPVAEHEIKDHIDICLKMFLENKITSKNAWNIKIIDYMRAFLQCIHANKDTLMMGSTSLDVGAKVYSIRVDDVHSIGFKLAADMAKMAQKQRTDDDCFDQPDDDAKKPAKKKKKFVLSGPKHTIVKDVDSLLADPPVLDSVFFQTKSNAEMSTLENFLTNRISKDKSGCTFTLMKNERSFTSYGDEDHSLSEKMFNFNVVPSVDKISLCPEFCSFEIDAWDPGDEDIMEQNYSRLNNELVLDDAGIPVAELDGSLQDIFHEPVDHEEDDQLPEDNPLFQEVVNVNDLRPTNSVNSSEYTYRSIIDQNKILTNIWAGPSHWKFKHIQPAVSKYSGVKEMEKRAMRRRGSKDRNVVINFTEEAVPADEVPEFKRRTAVKPWPETNNFCIRVNHEKVVVTLRSYLMKPAMRACPLKSPSLDHNHNESGDIAPYNYENLNDSLYCPQNVDDDHHDEGVGDEEGIVAATGYNSDNLIDLPEVAQVNFVPYATRAKKMNMKKLKASIWKILVDDTDNDEITDSLFNIQMKEPNTFSNVYSKLPEILNETMRKELSSPLAFVAVLHLANENNLNLVQHEDLVNFTIKAEN